MPSFSWMFAPFVILTAYSASGSDFLEDLQFEGPHLKAQSQTSFYTHAVNGLPRAEERFSFEGEGMVRYEEYALKAVPWIYGAVPYAAGGASRQIHAFVDPKELWMERTSADFDVRLGYQIFSWGSADRINPTDVANPVYYNDLFLNQKLPTLAARFQIHPEDWQQWNLELLVAPLFRASKLPLEIPDSGTRAFSVTDSRWLYPLPTSVSVGSVNFPLEYEVGESTKPSGTIWDQMDFGGRISVTDLEGWDFSLMGYNGVEKLPRFGFSRSGDAADPSLPLTLTLHPTYHRFQMLGVDAAGSASLSDDFVLGIRAEAAYTFSYNSRAEEAPSEFREDLKRRDFVHFVLGVDHTLSEMVLGTVMYINLQYVHFDRVGKAYAQPGNLVVQGLPNFEPFDRDLVLYLENRVGDSFKVSQSVIWSLKNSDCLFNPGFHFTFFDSLEAALEGQFYLGNEQGFFGQYRDSTRLVTTLSYQL